MDYVKIHLITSTTALSISIIPNICAPRSIYERTFGLAAVILPGKNFQSINPITKRIKACTMFVNYDSEYRNSINL